MSGTEAKALMSGTDVRHGNGSNWKFMVEPADKPVKVADIGYVLVSVEVAKAALAMTCLPIAK